MKKSFSLLLKNMCCSQCKSDFTEESVSFIQKGNQYSVINLICKNCGKNFGTSFLKLSKKNSKNIQDIILQDSRNIAPINFDDVLNAHEYIKDIEINLRKFISDKEL